MLVLAFAVASMLPFSSTPFRTYVDETVTHNREAFDRLLQEADQRVLDYRNDDVPADKKSPTHYAAIRDIAAGKGVSGEIIDLNKTFFPDIKMVREPNPEKKNNMLLQELLRRSQGKVKLGLDLQGGIAFILRVNPEAAEAESKALARAKTDEERAQLKKEAEKRAEEKIGQLDRAIEVMSERVDAFGVSEPVIRPVGNDGIEIQLPGEDTANNPDAINALKKPAKLEFRLVHRYEFPPRDAKEGDLISLRTNPLSAGSAVATYEVLMDEHIDRDTGEISRTPIYVKKAPEATGSIVNRAAPVSDGLSRYVSIDFTSAGGKIFGDITQRIADEDNANATKDVPYSVKNGRFAIVLDGKLMSAPTINASAGGKKTGIYGGSAQITGNFDQKEALDLANALNNPLEFPLELQDMTNIGGTLAEDAQTQSMNAALIGCACTILFALVFYRLGGLIAVIGIVVNVAILFGVQCAFGATLTLPGIAALVLTVGMAVDSNVLVYERIREEIAKGKSMRSAVQIGYDRAFLTILDSQLTTFLVAVVLILLGTGSVKGFGITLAIGIITTIFATCIFCRGLQEFLVEHGMLKDIFGVKFTQTPNFKFMNKWKASVVIVIAFMLLGAGTIAYRGDDCLGKDFKGGESVTMRIVQNEAIHEKIGVGEILKAAETSGVLDISAVYQQQVGASEKTLALECALTEDKSQGEFSNINKVAAAVKNAYPELFPTDATTLEEVVIGKRAVGASVSGQLIKMTIISLIVALFGIAVYVGLRFETGFGVSALISTLHDILVVTFIYLAFGGQLSSSMIAALLMVAGYSINDTIVVFDRIREELEMNPKMGLAEIIDLSINRTLTRTLMTSVTTLLTACALAYFGAGDVSEYGKVFIWGVIVGTFSSIFLAAPIFYWWHKGDREHVKEEQDVYRYEWEAKSSQK